MAIQKPGLSVGAQARPVSSFARNVMELLEKVEYRRCESGEDLEAVYRLRYEAFHAHGLLDRIPARRTAVVTGWALDSGAIYRFRCDAAFPLSDHAGYDDLLGFVERVRPKRVLTLHGFAREFAATLRARGIEAWAIGHPNQLEFALSG